MSLLQVCLTKDFCLWNFQNEYLFQVIPKWGTVSSSFLLNFFGVFVFFCQLAGMMAASWFNKVVFFVN
jgi:hypothetical protein